MFIILLSNICVLLYYFSSPAYRFLHLDRKCYFQANVLDYKFFEKGNPDSMRAYTTEAMKMWVLQAQNLL